MKIKEINEKLVNKELSSITDEFITNLYFNKDEHINSNYLKK